MIHNRLQESLRKSGSGMARGSLGKPEIGKRGISTVSS